MWTVSSLLTGPIFQTLLKYLHAIINLVGLHWTCASQGSVAIFCLPFMHPWDSVASYWTAQLGYNFQGSFQEPCSLIFASSAPKDHWAVFGLYFSCCLWEMVSTQAENRVDHRVHLFCFNSLKNCCPLPSVWE